jgi:MoaA/NifB/PqqE/SkfB family radical SAM enzyme
LPRIVRAIKAEGMTAMVCTSGRKPLLHLRKLVEAGLDLMAISLDVLDPACFRQLRGYELQPVLENLEGLARLRNRLDFQIVLSVVLTPLNIDLLEKVADLAQRLDLLVSVAPVQNGRQREDSLAVSLAFEPADEGRVAAAVAGLKAAGRRGVKLVNSDAFLDGIGRFLVHRSLPEGYRCRAGEFSGILMTDGGLKLCHSLEPLGGGTLVEQWLGREAELLRRRMARLDCPRCWLSCHVDERRPGVWVSGGTEGRQVR